MKRLSLYITRAILAAILGFALCTAPVAGAAPVSTELRARMAASGEGGQVPVIVHFTERLDLEPFARRSDHAQARVDMLRGLHDQARLSQGPLQAFLHRQGVTPTELWLINALAVRVPTALVPTLASWPGVAAVELDGEIPPPAPVLLAAPAAPTSNIAALGVQSLWDAGFTGSGIVVASLDSGVDVSHPDLAGSWRGGSNSWFDPYTIPPTIAPYDGDALNGHGTAVTSLMVGATRGVAPDAQWIAAKIFPDNGNADISKIHRAFQWILDPDNNPATDDAVADVVNNSWGFDTLPNQCYDDFRSDIQVLQSAGIHVVFSAGNNGPASSTSVSPGNGPEGLAVGSIEPTSLVSSFSSRGPNICSGTIYDDLVVDVYPEVVAPGGQVEVAIPRNIFPSGYGFATGTSFSAPHVAGALALLRSAVPPEVSESAADYRLRLERGLLTASADLGPLGPDNSYGRGLVDLPAAYARLAAQPHLSVYDPTAPENDNTLDFGPVAPGLVKDLSILMKNVGGSDLTLTTIDASGLPAPELSLVSNNCPGLLAPGASCTLTVRFAPLTFTNTSGQIMVTSNDAASPLGRELHVTGIGNGLPPPAQLVGPSRGTVGVTMPVTFSWIQAPDRDGDTLTMILSIDRDPDFSPPVDRIFPNLIVGATAGLAVAMTVFLVGPYRNHRRLFLASTLLLVLWIVVACGGDGGGGGGVTVVVPNSSRTVDNLDPLTTYYWKVQTSDSHGGVSESDIWSFTTR